MENLKAVMNQVEIPVFVMVRPRGGNFVYTAGEFELMCSQLLMYKSAGVAGFVFGCLNESGHLNEEMNVALVGLAGALPCTFHRAADHTPDLFETTEKLVQLGFKRVLTSGGKGNAADNVQTLKEMVRIFNGRIGILPGGGVRSSNINALLQTGADEYHSSGITASSNQQADAEEIKKIIAAMA